jgi:hypothetical protein
MKTDQHIASARRNTFLFLAAQITPPFLMFWLAFGEWGIGTGIIVGLPMLFSAIHVPLLLYKKQIRLLLRPVLTLLLALTIVIMGNYYSRESARYVDQLARQMQEQCNRDGFCKLPPGEWTSSDSNSTLFYTRTKGLVPMYISLTFNEYEPNKEPSCTEAATQPKCPDHKPQGTLRFTSFHLARLVEDHSYHVYGGVERSLKISGIDEEK